MTAQMYDNTGWCYLYDIPLDIGEMRILIGLHKYLLDYYPDLASLKGKRGNRLIIVSYPGASLQQPSTQRKTGQARGQDSKKKSPTGKTSLHDAIKIANREYSFREWQSDDCWREETALIRQIEDECIKDTSRPRRRILLNIKDRRQIIGTMPLPLEFS